MYKAQHKTYKGLEFELELVLLCLTLCAQQVGILVGQLGSDSLIRGMGNRHPSKQNHNRQQNKNELHQKKIESLQDCQSAKLLTTVEHVFFFGRPQTPFFRRLLARGSAPCSAHSR